MMQLGPTTWYPCVNCGRTYPEHADSTAVPTCPGFAPVIPPTPLSELEISARALRFIEEIACNDYEDSAEGRALSRIYMLAHCVADIARAALR